LDNGPQNREDKWTKSIAVGNKGFVETVKSALGFRAKGRKTREAGAGFELREPPAPYGALFGGKFILDSCLENNYFALENGKRFESELFAVLRYL